MLESPKVNDSEWLTHAMVDSAIRREASVSQTFDYRDECYRVGADFLGDLLASVLDDRAIAAECNETDRCSGHIGSCSHGEGI